MPFGPLGFIWGGAAICWGWAVRLKLVMLHKWVFIPAK
jgi:hypothetical protein